MHSNLTPKQSNKFLLIIILLNIFGGILLSRFIKSSKISLFISQYIFILLPCVLYAFFYKVDFKKDLKFNFINLKQILICILIAFFSLPFINLIAQISSYLFGNQIVEVMDSLKNYTPFEIIFILAITPAICEEFILRGIVLNSHKEFSKPTIIILNGFLFGLFHMNLQQFSYAFFMGMLFAYIVITTNSIFSSMIMHFVNNSIPAISLIFIKNLPKDSPATKLDVVSILILIFIVLISTSIVFLLLKKLKSISSEESKLVDDYSIYLKQEILLSSPSKKPKFIDIYSILYTLVFLVFSVSLMFLKK